MRRMKQQTPSICEDCGDTYMKYRPHQLFCSQICRQRHFWKTLKAKAAMYDEAQRAKSAKPMRTDNDLFAAQL